MGVAGVAIATVISQVISAVLILMCLLKMDGMCRLHKDKIKLHGDKVKEMLRIGIPAGLQGIVFSISNVLIQSSVNSFGSTVMAGNTAASNIEGLHRDERDLPDLAELHQPEPRRRQHRAD